MPPSPVPNTSLNQLLWRFAAIAMTTIAVEHGGRLLQLQAYTHLILAALFLTAAVQLAQLHPGGLAGHGLWLGGLLEPSSEERPGLQGAVQDLLRVLYGALPSACREIGVALTVAAITFPPFIVGFCFFHQPSRDFVFLLPEAPFDFLAAQLLVVALPEEAFFRGYIQTQLTRTWPPNHTLFGKPWPLQALVFQALLFALLHYLVDLHPARLAVFFPALLFGAIRELRGGIGAALVYHALCNVLSELLVRGLL